MVVGVRYGWGVVRVSQEYCGVVGAGEYTGEPRLLSDVYWLVMSIGFDEICGGNVEMFEMPGAASGRGRARERELLFFLPCMILSGLGRSA